jgi:hypothetical protein
MLLAGCSLDASIGSSLAPDDAISFNNPATGEIVAGSTQYVTTNVRGYLVQASAGALVTDTVQKSNVRQYQIYQNVQGRMISEDKR